MQALLPPAQTRKLLPVSGNSSQLRSQIRMRQVPGLAQRHYKPLRGFSVCSSQTVDIPA